MRLPRVRFTVRRMAVAVAVVGVAIGGTLNVRRWLAFRRMAVQHSQATESWLYAARHFEQTGECAVGCLVYFESDPDEIRKKARGFRALASFHQAMVVKYEYALVHPWLPVPPDPPEPPEPE
jgi:hypothetical protein